VLFSTYDEVKILGIAGDDEIGICHLLRHGQRALVDRKVPASNSHDVEAAGACDVTERGFAATRSDLLKELLSRIGHFFSPLLRRKAGRARSSIVMLSEASHCLASQTLRGVYP